MFIRQVKKQRSKDSKVFYQYTLAQTSRVNGKVKQFSILYLGSDPRLADKENRAIVLRILKSKIFNQAELFPLQVPKQLVELANDYYAKYCIKYDKKPNPTSIPPNRDKADFQSVDIEGMSVLDSREFGAENLCKHMLSKLQLDQFFDSLGFSSSKRDKALISIAAKAIYRSSEFKTAQILQTNSSLKECYRYNKDISYKQLYSIADLLYKHKSQIDQFLYNRITDMFNLEDKLVIFDISNTYFETAKRNSKIAKHGRSKQKRNDCPLVVFTGVINSDGFIRHSRIYEGNKPDSKTLIDMINDLKKYSPQNAGQTIVIDAGIADDENLEIISKSGYKYVCVSRKRLKDYPLDKTKPTVKKLTHRKKDNVELQIFNPQGYNDTWMYVQSPTKRKKEESINNKLTKRFEERLMDIRGALTKKGGTKSINKVHQRIGRAKQMYNKVSSMYKINVTEKDGKATDLSWTIVANKIKEDKIKGIYFIRTNHDTKSESELWDIYNTIREVESTFRSLKTDLNLRPIHHQNDTRIEAHLYLTILAYQLVNAIRYMLKKQNVTMDWNNIIRIMSTHKLQTVLLPTKTKNIYIRKPSQTIDQAKKIYKYTGCPQSFQKTKKYVVYH